MFGFECVNNFTCWKNQDINYYLVVLKYFLKLQQTNVIIFSYALRNCKFGSGNLKVKPSKFTCLVGEVRNNKEDDIKYELLAKVKIKVLQIYNNGEVLKQKLTFLVKLLSPGFMLCYNNLVGISRSYTLKLCYFIHGAVVLEVGCLQYHDLRRRIMYYKVLII